MRLKKVNSENKKIFLYGLISVVILTITITFMVSRANYRATASYELASGTVTASPYDFNILSIYLEDGENYSEINSMPEKDYVINEEKSYCYIGNKDNIDKEASIYTNELGEHVIANLMKGDKCILYFDQIKTIEELLSNYYTDKRVRTEDTFYQTINNEMSKVIYTTEDDYGTTYYFAGNPTDNWVEFGDYYWRIIRINGNGSIRLIYQGRTQDEKKNKLEPQATGEETQVETSAFNTNNDDNAYVGFMYGTPESPTYEATHENINDSTVKTALDNWFIYSNIKQGTKYFDKIDKNVGFCGDRMLDSGSGIGKTYTIYKATSRVHLNQEVKDSPTLMCNNNNDLYTYKNNDNGNKSLVYPVGLITIDEVSYAGMRGDSSVKSENNYLNTDQSYWTMSPNYAVNAAVFAVFPGGYIFNVWVQHALGIRPVINLRSDVKLTGHGTITNPYKVLD
ncbi:MAG: hypothetical protein NC483_06250 [Ruminococcus sp.]|nr:hypothetical protein [Ruminococcus sp.]